MTALATFSFGMNIKSTGINSLKRVSAYEVYMAISKPEAGLRDLCTQLSKVVKVHADAYRTMKTGLPFFCGSTFAQDYRKLEYFEAANYCIIDIDKCFENQEQFETLKARLRTDENVMLMFTSPSGKGLKVVCQLATPIHSTKQYADFYAVFSRAFAERHEIIPYVDFVTKDATRVCFLNADEEAYYNALSEPVIADQYLSAFDLLAKTENLPIQATQPYLEEVKTAAISPDTYAGILNKLNPHARPIKEKSAIIPEALHQAIGPVADFLAGLGLEIVAIKDINYGKQIQVKYMNTTGEANLHYGKSGFSVVKSNKSGTNVELNGVLASAIEEVIWKYTHPVFPTMESIPGASSGGATTHDS
jgi:hypothetical protein